MESLATRDLPCGRTLKKKAYVDCALHSQYKMQTMLSTKLDTAHWTTLRVIRVDVRHNGNVINASNANAVSAGD